MKLLVTDGDERAALAVVRSLGRAHTIHVGAARRPSLAGRSRFASAQHRLPDPLSSEAEFGRTVGELVRSHSLDAIFPVSDASHTALLEHEDLGAQLLAPSREAYHRLSDKALVGQLATQVGLGAPESLPVAGAGDVLEAAATLGWPIVLKPTRSVDTGANDDERSKLGVVVVADPQDVADAWEKVSRAEQVLAQRFVPGHGEGVFLLRYGGRTLASFGHRRLREKPPGGGISVLRESVTVRPDRLRQVEQILEAVDFEGIAMAELRVHDDESWLMEFNARIWGSVQLAIDAGVDFPNLLLETFQGHGPTDPPPFRPGVRLRWLLGELDHALSLARGSENTDGRSGVREAMGVLLCPAGPDCRWEVLRAEDPRPFLYELGAWFAELLGRR